MILLDVNVLLAAHRDDHPDHADALTFLESLVENREAFGVPVTVWHSFLRLATNRRIFEVPTPVDRAIDFIGAVVAQPVHQRCEPGVEHLEILFGLVSGFGASGDLVPDAALAAIAIENASALASFDHDFARFDTLEWIRPGS